MATELLGKKVVGQKVTVTAAITAIPATATSGRQTIVLRNEGSNTVFLGADDVTTANGFPLKAGESQAFDAADGCIIYGRTATDTSEVRTLEGV